MWLNADGRNCTFIMTSDGVFTRLGFIIIIIIINMHNVVNIH